MKREEAEAVYGPIVVVPNPNATPFRGWDFTAFYDDLMDLGAPHWIQAEGATEEAALEALLEQTETHMGDLLAEVVEGNGAFAKGMQDLVSVIDRLLGTETAGDRRRAREAMDNLRLDELQRRAAASRWLQRQLGGSVTEPRTLREQSANNTDREIWRRKSADPSDPDGFYQPSIHVTEGDGIGMNVGGFVIVMPIDKWHALAKLAEPPQDARDAVIEECCKAMCPYCCQGIPFVRSVLGPYTHSVTAGWEQCVAAPIRAALKGTR